MNLKYQKKTVITIPKVNNLTNNKILQIMVEVNENYREQLDTILNIMKDCNFKLTDKFKASIPNGEIDKFSKTYNYLFER